MQAFADRAALNETMQTRCGVHPRRAGRIATSQQARNVFQPQSWRALVQG